MLTTLLFLLVPLGRPEAIREMPRPVPAIGGPVARAQLAAWLAHSRHRWADLDVRAIDGELHYRLSLIENLPDSMNLVTERGHDLDRLIHAAVNRWATQDWDPPTPLFTSASLPRSEWTPAETPPPEWRPVDMPTRPAPDDRPPPRRMEPRPGPGPFYQPPQYGQPPYPWGGLPHCPPGGG